MIYPTVIAIIATICFLLSVASLRMLHIRNQPPRKKSRKTPSHLVAILGSGGHTTEMISLLKDIDPVKYIHRTYIVSSGDDFASERVCEIERIIQKQLKPLGPTNTETCHSLTGTWDVKTVPRARKIHQHFYTTPFSALWCAIECLKVLRSISNTSIAAPNEYPDVIVANGPATSVIFFLAATSLKFFGIAPTWKLKMVYIESWARVKNLSLSGRILLSLGICDKLLVQWESLANEINKKGAKKVEWKGLLVE